MTFLKLLTFTTGTTLFLNVCQEIDDLIAVVFYNAFQNNNMEACACRNKYHKAYPGS